MLLRRKGKLTIAKSKSSRLSYSEVVSLPLESIISKISRYDADLSILWCPFIQLQYHFKYGVFPCFKNVDRAYNAKLFPATVPCYLSINSIWQSTRVPMFIKVLKYTSHFSYKRCTEMCCRHIFKSISKSPEDL
jgi:hypothetical protein